MPSEDKEPGSIPLWAGQVHPSHQWLLNGGGFLCCVRCGALAASRNLRSGLFAACPASTGSGWSLPEGSKGRLERFKRGLHPEGRAARYWPDGRKAGNAIMINVARRPNPGSSDRGAVLARATAEDMQDACWLESLLGTESDRAQRAGRVAEIHEAITAAFEAAGPGQIADLGAMRGYIQEEVREAIAKILGKAEGPWPAWRICEQHFAEAQLCRWPATAAGSVLGFGKAVIAIEECISGYAKEYQAGGGYPEDIPIFTDLEDWPKGEVCLAASHVAAYADIFVEDLQEAAEYVSEQLMKLANSQ